MLSQEPDSQNPVPIPSRFGMQEQSARCRGSPNVAQRPPVPRYICPIFRLEDLSYQNPF